MPLKYLIDENLRGKFTRALLERAYAESLSLDLVEVGDSGTPALGTGDEELLRWCAAQGRVLVSLDTNTMPDHLEHHVASGAFSPGVLLIRRSRAWKEIIDFLVLCAEAMAPDECANQCVYIPS